jgi:hypothetical protein
VSVTVATNGSAGFEGFGVKKDFGNAVVDFLRVDGERTTLRVSGFACDVVGVVASMSDVSLPLTVVCGLRETVVVRLRQSNVRFSGPGCSRQARIHLFPSTDKACPASKGGWYSNEAALA